MTNEKRRHDVKCKPKANLIVQNVIEKKKQPGLKEYIVGLH
jgi:hypothetical protein